MTPNRLATLAGSRRTKKNRRPTRRSRTCCEEISLARLTEEGINRPSISSDPHRRGSSNQGDRRARSQGRPRLQLARRLGEYARFLQVFRANGVPLLGNRGRIDEDSGTGRGLLWPFSSPQGRAFTGVVGVGLFAIYRFRSSGSVWSSVRHSWGRGEDHRDLAQNWRRGASLVETAAPKTFCHSHLKGRLHIRANSLGPDALMADAEERNTRRKRKIFERKISGRKRSDRKTLPGSGQKGAGWQVWWNVGGRESHNRRRECEAADCVVLQGINGRRHKPGDRPGAIPRSIARVYPSEEVVAPTRTRRRGNRPRM